MSQKITVLTVNWYSADLIRDLFSNLINKAQTPSNLFFLIIDNTNGHDEKLKNISFPNVEVQIIENQPGNLKNLYAHAHGLNLGFKKINSDFVLIVDPDVHVFKTNWDTFLTETLNANELNAIGTSYPPWWLGTYHNFPSPIFFFAKTHSLKAINADWSPPATNIITKTRNLVLRQLLRGFFLFNRRQLTRSPVLRKLTKKMEKIFPTCSLDTGFLLSQQQKLKTSLFKAKYPDQLPKEADFNEAYQNLAQYFELYWHENEPILTHQYGSQNFLLKTQKGKNRELWFELINKVEKNITQAIL